MIFINGGFKLSNIPLKPITKVALKVTLNDYVTL